MPERVPARVVTRLGVNRCQKSEEVVPNRRDRVEQAREKVAQWTLHDRLDGMHCVLGEGCRLHELVVLLVDVFPKERLVENYMRHVKVEIKAYRVPKLNLIPTQLAKCTTPSGRSHEFDSTRSMELGVR